MKNYGYAVSIFLVLLFLGCAKIPGNELRSEPSIGAPTFYVCPGVSKSPLFISIKIKQKTSTQPDALLLPFTIRQEMDHRAYLGQELGKKFLFALQQEKVFHTITYQTTAQSLDQSLAQAKMVGTGLLIVPTINYLFCSGSQGLFALDLHVDIYSAKTQQLVWSSEQDAELRRPFYQDYILFRTSPRMPTSPATHTIIALTHDLASALRIWLGKRPDSADRPAVHQDADDKNSQDH